MDKTRVNDLIPLAYAAIKTVGIEKNNEIEKTFRGQISTFGTAISMGSLLSAIAFFSDSAGAAVDRTLLLKALNEMLNPNCDHSKKNDFYHFVSKQIEKGKEDECKDEVIHATIALKLAMNLYKLKDVSDK